MKSVISMLARLNSQQTIKLQTLNGQLQSGPWLHFDGTDLQPHGRIASKTPPLLREVDWALGEDGGADQRGLSIRVTPEPSLGRRTFFLLVTPGCVLGGELTYTPYTMGADGRHWHQERGFCITCFFFLSFFFYGFRSARHVSC